MFRLPSDLTVASANQTLEAGLAAINSGEREINFKAVTAVDSVAVAIMLAWRRAARAKGVSLLFRDVPANLRSLAELYGVSHLLYMSAQMGSRTDLPHH